MEQIKFTDEEMSELRNNQQKFNELIIKLGQYQLDMINNVNQANKLAELELKLKTEYAELKVSDKQMSDKLSAKYGEGILNPETGVFTPKKNDEITETNKQ